MYSITKAYRSTAVFSTLKATTKRTMTAFSHMSDNDPAVIEKEKKKSLGKKNKEWSEKLASHSEAAVKADRDYDKPVKHLQNETIEELKKKDREDKQ